MVSSRIARYHSSITGTGLLSYIRSLYEVQDFWPRCIPHILSLSGYRPLQGIKSGHTVFITRKYSVSPAMREFVSLIGIR